MTTGEEDASSPMASGAEHVFDRREWRRALEIATRLTRGRPLVACCAALFAVPALFDLLSNVRRAPFRWIAADTFYYLAVGRNIVRHGVVGFDGQNVSNGFHPLWQAFSALVELLCEHFALDSLGPFLLVLSGVLALTLSIWLLGLTLLAAERGTLLFLGLPVGLYALLALPVWLIGLPAIVAHGLRSGVLPVFGSLWSYANGMESAFTILAFSSALFLGSAPSTLDSARRSALFGAALSALTLSRLDHGLIAAPMLVGFALFGARSARLQNAVVAALAFALPVATYLWLNHRYFGSYVPLSGVAKSTFPQVTSDNVRLIRELLNGSPSASKLAPDSHWWLPVVCRQLQTLLPALLCVGYLLFRAIRSGARRLQALLASAAIGALALAGYNFAFTKGEDQGFWYYPVSTLLPSLFVLSERRTWLRLPAPGHRLLALGGLCGLMLGFFIYWQRHPRYNEDFADMALRTSEEARRFYAGAPPKLLEIDDGVVGYSLQTHAMSCFLGLDRGGFDALRQSKLLDLALARGYDRVASSAYQPAGRSPQDLATWIGLTLHQDVSAFRFETELATSDGRLLVVRVQRR